MKSELNGYEIFGYLHASRVAKCKGLCFEHFTEVFVLDEQKHPINGSFYTTALGITDAKRKPTILILSKKQ